MTHHPYYKNKQNKKYQRYKDKLKNINNYILIRYRNYNKCIYNII
jgi:hypothetical protein